MISVRAVAHLTFVNNSGPTGKHAKPQAQTRVEGILMQAKKLIAFQLNDGRNRETHKKNHITVAGGSRNRNWGPGDLD